MNNAFNILTETKSGHADEFYEIVEAKQFIKTITNSVSTS
jgi:hypothetical protein